MVTIHAGPGIHTPQIPSLGDGQRCGGLTALRAEWGELEHQPLWPRPLYRFGWPRCHGSQAHKVRAPPCPGILSCPTWLLSAPLVPPEHRGGAKGPERTGPAGSWGATEAVPTASDASCLDSQCPFNLPRAQEWWLLLPAGAGPSSALTQHIPPMSWGKPRSLHSAQMVSLQGSGGQQTPPQGLSSWRVSASPGPGPAGTRVGCKTCHVGTIGGWLAKPSSGQCSLRGPGSLLPALWCPQQPRAGDESSGALPGCPGGQSSWRDPLVHGQVAQVGEAPPALWGSPPWCAPTGAAFTPRGQSPGHRQRTRTCALRGGSSGEPGACPAG